MPSRRLPAAILQLLLVFHLLAILGSVTRLNVLVAEVGKAPLVTMLFSWVGVPSQLEPTTANGKPVNNMRAQSGETNAAGPQSPSDGVNFQDAPAPVRAQLPALHSTPASGTLTPFPAGQADALNQLEGRALAQRAPHYAMRGDSHGQASSAHRRGAAALEATFQAPSVEASPNFSRRPV